MHFFGFAPSDKHAVVHALNVGDTEGLRLGEVVAAVGLAVPELSVGAAAVGGLVGDGMGD